MAAQDLVTLAQVREVMELPSGDTARDVQVASLITRASDSIMGYCEREFAPATTSATRRRRIFTDRRDSRTGLLFVDLAPYDLRSATTVTLHPETTAPKALVADTDYVLDPTEKPSGVYTEILLSRLLDLNSSVMQKFGWAYLDVLGAWGFATVPTDVQHLCIVTVRAWLDRGLASFDLAASSEQSLSPSIPGGYRLPRGVRDGLSRWRRRIGF